MKKTISAINIETNVPETIKYYPVKECPLCHVSFDGTHLSGYYSHAYFDDGKEDLGKYFLYVTHFCYSCNQAFLGVYHNAPNGLFELLCAVPKTVRNIDFSPAINKLSPLFVSTYNEALEAEESNLLRICGLGYRKSLEYLIKDYLIYKEPDEKSKVLDTSLGTLIKNKIESNKLKTLASRSAWLGNDEAHYLKYHEEYDIQDLKEFITAIVTFFDAELSVDKALKIKSKKSQ